MPIEIKELHIRVTVDATHTGQSSGQRNETSGRGRVDDDGSVREATVGECVEQVLQIIANKAER